MHQNGWMMARLDSIYLSISNNEAMWRPHETMKWPNGGTIMYRQNKTVIIHFVASRYVVSHSHCLEHIKYEQLWKPYHIIYTKFHGNYDGNTAASMVTVDAMRNITVKTICSYISAWSSTLAWWCIAFASQQAKHSILFFQKMKKNVQRSTNADNRSSYIGLAHAHQEQNRSRKNSSGCMYGLWN